MRFPELEEFQRAHALKPEFFRRLQRIVRTEIIPCLDDVERLQAENLALQAKVETLTKRRGAA
jgi:hypothetical protein